MKIVVLYEELAWYFVNCMNVLATEYNCEIMILCKEKNRNAPFHFKYVHKNITILNREGFHYSGLLKKLKIFEPDFIFLAGWIYKPYLKLIKNLSRPVIIGFDNQWTGSIKQILGAVYFRVRLKRYINCAFVPGPRQGLFARKLGFKEHAISQGAYCCDYDFFNSEFKKNQQVKSRCYPRKLLFVGRYVGEKDVTRLWKVFSELEAEGNDWELWCVGTGSITPWVHPKIKHLGFVQPEDMGDIIANTSVFILPSIFEPWGVVVHEFASAGYPMVCSDRVGAGDLFMLDGANGFIFKAGDDNDMKLKLRKLLSMSQQDYNSMSEKSVALAAQLTPRIWAASLMNLYKKNESK